MLFFNQAAKSILILSVYGVKLHLNKEPFEALPPNSDCSPKLITALITDSI
jgi:hypothetical protein